MYEQIIDKILVVDPEGFGYNPETSSTNSYQHQPDETLTTKEKALKEHAKALQKLEPYVEIIKLRSPQNHLCPDAVFPNNWLLTMNNEIVLCPMKNNNRRMEVQPIALRQLLESNGFMVKYHSLVHYVNDNQALEGTGSMVLARDKKVAFAAISERTSEYVFREFCEWAGFRPVCFFTKHAEMLYLPPVYHTNVMLSIGKNFVVVCKDLIYEKDREYVLDQIYALDKEVIEISVEQVDKFCGNILELSTKKDPSQSIILMSSTALVNFSNSQLDRLFHYGKIIDIDIPIIESVGGGSARCMVCELFLEREVVPGETTKPLTASDHR